jgi:hypothetical protein
MEIEFAVAEMVRLLTIVNNWPVRKAGEWRLMDALGEKVTLTPEEKEACRWQEVTVADRRGYQFDGGVSVRRALTDRERATLLTMVQNPPIESPWYRGDRMIYDSLVKKLCNGEEPNDEEAQ